MLNARHHDLDSLFLFSCAAMRLVTLDTNNKQQREKQHQQQQQRFETITLDLDEEASVHFQNMSPGATSGTGHERTESTNGRASLRQDHHNDMASVQDSAISPGLRSPWSALRLGHLLKVQKSFGRRPLERALEQADRGRLRLQGRVQ